MTDALIGNAAGPVVSDAADVSVARLGEGAYHGVAGDVVRRIAPHTEADPAALLLTFLAACGAALGPGPHALADGAEHPPRLNVVLVGATSRARKGTSWAVIGRLMRRADPFYSTNVLGGISTGEGLIAAFAETAEPGSTSNPTWLLAYEPEFARLLRVAARSPSLSAVLREAWDSTELAVLTRKEPLRASGAHLGIIAHITADELHRDLRQVEIVNGLSNRFLWAHVRRSKRLPFGGDLSDELLDPLAARVAGALESGRAVGQLTMTSAARRHWSWLYRALSDDVPGVVGSLTARAEAQLLRLAVLYAALDGSTTVEIAHLDAAQAVWAFCERSVTELFAPETIDDRLARTLLAALAERPEGLDGTQQRDLFARHVSGERLAKLRRDLESRGLVSTHKERTAGRSRLVTRLRTRHLATDVPAEQFSSHRSRVQRALSSQASFGRSDVREPSGTLTWASDQ